MKYYYIGTDEAGYGPNLGPLLVSSSMWGADVPATDDPLTLLNTRVLKSVGYKEGFRICDSKRIYHSGHLAPLERSFYFALESSLNRVDDLPLFRHEEVLPPYYPSWLSVVHSISTSPQSELKFSPPWENEITFSLPLTGLQGWTERFPEDYSLTTARLESEGIHLLGIASRRVQPYEFNIMLDRLDLKSELLAEATLETALFLLRPILDNCSEKKEILLCCDKLGGRNRYGDLLMRYFPESKFEIEIESREVSAYRFPLSRGHMSVIFQAKGETNIPTAMASIVSKYQREISMIAFNRYWQKRKPSLAPTAGYPADAKRFRMETKDLRHAEGISEDCFWRKK